MPDGKYVGCGRDTNPIPLQASVTPSAGYTFSWSVAQGPGDGTFDNPGQQDVNFFGTVRDHCKVQVVATNGQVQCSTQADVVVIEITDLTEEVTPRIMPDNYLSGTGATFVLPFTDSNGELRSVLIAPPDNPDDPFEWGTDFSGLVDHSTGDVILTFNSDGPYLIQAIRADPSDNETDEFCMVYLNCGDGTKGTCNDGPFVKVASPTGTLVMVDGSKSDNGYLGVARTCLSGSTTINSVADVNNAIAAYAKAHPNVPFSALLVAHGNVAIVGMGNGENGSTGDGMQISNLAGDQASLNSFLAACKGKISTFSFFACCVAAGTDGTAFLQSIATGGAMKAVAPNVKTTVTNDSRGCTWYLVKGGTNVSLNP